MRNKRLPAFHDVCIVFILVICLLPVSQASARADLPKAGNPQAPGPVDVEIPLSKITGPLPILMTGLSSSTTFDMPIDESWKVTSDVLITLKASASEVLDRNSSSLTFYVNEKAVTSLFLKDLPLEGARVKLPLVWFGGAKQTLTVVSRLHLVTDNETKCRDWNDPTRWLSISPETTLSLSVIPQDTTIALENFPRPFFNPSSPVDGSTSSTPVVFVLPDPVTNDSLTSLAAVNFLFGKEQANLQSWKPIGVLKSALDADRYRDDNLVFIGGSHRGLLTVQENGKDFVGLYPSPFNPRRAALVIFDANEKDNSRPELALLDPNRKMVLSGNVAYLEPLTAPLPGPAPYQKTLTFKSLGYSERTARGLGVQNLIYRFYVPYNVQLSNTDMMLHLAHSEAVADGTSVANIYLNGVAVAGVLLDQRKNAAEPVEIDLPSARIRPGYNFLRFTFDMRTSTNTCTWMTEAAWATVFNTTSLNFTSADQTPLPNLETLPQPFNDLGGADIVVPDQVDGDLLNRIASISVMLGQSAYSSALPPKVISAAKFLTEKENKNHLIFVGTPQQNAAIKQVNTYLPQPFTSDGTSLDQGYGVELAGGPLTLGLLEISRSPWEKDHRFLVITGTNAEGMKLAWDYLLNTASTAPLPAGNVLVVSPNNRVSARTNPEPQSAVAAASYSVGDTNNIPVIGPLVRSLNQPGLALSLAAILLALVVLLAALLVWQFIARRRAERQSAPKGHGRD